MRDFSAPRSAFSAFIPGTSWNLENDLKDVAYLKRYRKKDLKPSRAEILRGGVAWPRWCISFPGRWKSPGRIRASFFNIQEMRVMGELEN
jgi:hypothetical protein